MITPAFIHVIYWIGIVAVEFIGFNTIREGSPIRGTLGILLGLVVIPVGCEVRIVLFRINDNLAAIRESNGK